MTPIWIYAPTDSARLRYVLREVFAGHFSIGFEVCTDLEAFKNFPGPRLQYAPRRVLAKGVWIPACPLLFESGVHGPLPEVGRHAGLPTLFLVKEARDEEWPFDLFAAVFFLLSRYEEYLVPERDLHGRFPAKASLAAQHGFLELPVKDRWLENLAKQLETAFPSLEITRPAFAFCPTFDIDQAWAFRHKPLWRQLGGWAKDFLKGRFRLAAQRLAVWVRLQPDPFDRYEYLCDQLKLLDGQPLFFFLVGDPGPYDKNTPPFSSAFRKLVGNLGKQAVIGLHPSYRSAEDPKRVAVEKGRLELLSGRPVEKSRQHFLRLRFPDTYRALLEAGIREDYTMGYAEAPGFRAGTAVPFRWYDLGRETATELLVHPFQVMDVSLRQYLGFSPAAAMEKNRQLMQEVRRTGGEFIAIWHNSSFHEADGWAGWNAVFEDLLQASKTPEGDVGK